MNKEQRYNTLYMDIAERVSAMSFAVRLKVGCVIVKQGNIISMGWNGMPSGMDNCCETNDTTNPEVLHAEMNAICKLAKSTNSAENATLYITHAPCINCAKHIHQAGIKEVIYKYRYNGPSGDGVKLLTSLNIKVENIDAQQ